MYDVHCMCIVLEPEFQGAFIAQSLQPGPSVSLKCSARANPLPEIQWSVDGNELLPTPQDPLQARYWQLSDRYSIGSFGSSRVATEVISHVNITNVRVEDSGRVTCTATNLVGTKSHSARLNIYGEFTNNSVHFSWGATPISAAQFNDYDSPSNKMPTIKGPSDKLFFFSL